MRAGLKIVLLLPLFALMAPTGGYPSKPTFQSVNVSGAVTATGTVTGGALTTAGVLTGGNTVLGGSVQVGQSLQAKGLGLAGFTGAGTELLNSGTAGGVQSYNRTSLAYLPLFLSGSTVGISYGQSAVHAIDVNAIGQISLNGAPVGNLGSLWLPAANGQIGVMPFGAGAAAQSFLQLFQDNNVYLDSANSGTPTGGNIILRGTGVTQYMALGANGVTTTAGNAGQGAGTLNATALYQGGSRVPKTAAIYAGGAGCTITTNINFASCLRNSAGNYSFTFSASMFASAPVCTSGINTTTNTLVVIQGVNAASVNAVNLVSGTPSDSAVYLICVGT